MRGERIECSFAHMYETGGLRRMHLRGHDNIRKRILVHAGAFNLGLLMRRCLEGALLGACRALISSLSPFTIAIRDACEAMAAH
jgi:transposase